MKKLPPSELSTQALAAPARQNNLAPTDSNDKLDKSESTASAPLVAAANTAGVSLRNLMLK
jgi:hypothetical protein